GAAKRIWVAFKDIGAQIFKESGDSVELVRDFYQSGKKQRFLGLQRMTVDPVTENLYIASGDYDVFKMTNWNTMLFTKCSLDVVPPAIFRPNPAPGLDDRQIAAPDVTVDARNRYLIAPMHPNSSAAYRFTLDDHYHKLVPLGSTGSARISTLLLTNENAACLYQDKGLVPSPDGGLVSLYGWGYATNDYQKVHLQYHFIDPATGDSVRISIDSLGTRSGGVRMDLKGNVYAGARLGAQWTAPDSVPQGYAGDESYKLGIGKIYKYSPSGTFEQGKLYNNASKLAPAKVYNIGYGVLPIDGKGFNTRFGVDYYGRIYYPNTLTQTVAVMDNEGNQLFKFGTYGNLDAWLDAQANPSAATTVPLSWPNSVDATEDYIYVADYVNSGVVRMKKEYLLDNLSGSSFGHVVSETVKASRPSGKILSVYPNPFSSKSFIQINVQKSGIGSVKVYDMRGRLLTVLAEGFLRSGFHQFEWNGTAQNGHKQGAGVYLVKFNVDGKSINKRVIRF
ncbi:MAG: T9SS type A sorting domain-containing protein, partial [Fibrobacteres bacterium]|nr:T9SS type A sorting domain-containing protein [Fibrobacterota bacterium]